MGGNRAIEAVGVAIVHRRSGKYAVREEKRRKRRGREEGSEVRCAMERQAGRQGRAAQWRQRQQDECSRRFVLSY